MHYYILLFSALITAVFSCGNPGNSPQTTVETDSIEAISYRVDPFWPEDLPGDWLIGQVAGVAIDSKDQVWISHRPGSLGMDEIALKKWPDLKPVYSPAPPVIAFNTNGEIVQSWGGPGGGYEWPKGEHGIYVDFEDHVWIGGANPDDDHQILKFTADGEFLLQIGRSGKTGGSNDTTALGFPTDVAVDPVEREVYVADGYLNRRVIVFDAYSGKYKRHWGAYGEQPVGNISEDADPLQQFNIVHGIGISNDGLVYVCDRMNNRIQVFEKSGKFIREGFIARDTPGHGSTWDLDFSKDPQQSNLYVADGSNQCVWIVSRKDLKVTGKFGRVGRYAGQFIWVHNVALDSKENLYTGEVYTGKRVQKFVNK